MGREVVLKWGVLAFGGVEVKTLFFGLTGTAVKGVSENVMAVTGGGEFDVISNQEAVCRQVVG